MSLDVVRALQKTGGEALVALQSRVEEIVKSAPSSLVDTGAAVSLAMSNILKTIHANPDKIQANARDLCLSIAHTYITALLLGGSELQSPAESKLHVYIFRTRFTDQN